MGNPVAENGKVLSTLDLISQYESQYAYVRLWKHNRIMVVDDEAFCNATIGKILSNVGIDIKR